MSQEKILASGWMLPHLEPINFPLTLTEEEIQFYLKLPAVCVISGKRSDMTEKHISLSALCNGVTVVIAQIPYVGDDQAILAELLQTGADFLRNNEIKPALDKRD